MRYQTGAVGMLVLMYKCVGILGVGA